MKKEDFDKDYWYVAIYKPTQKRRAIIGVDFELNRVAAGSGLTNGLEFPFVGKIEDFEEWKKTKIKISEESKRYRAKMFGILMD